MNHPPCVQDIERERGVYWLQLADLEPGLYPLLWRARQEGAACRDWPEAQRAFARIQSELTDLVGLLGRHHRHPILGTVGAYEVAYWKLYEAVTGLLKRPATEATPHLLSVLSAAQSRGEPRVTEDTPGREDRMPSMPTDPEQGWVSR
jgi:hypothetical protein